MTHLKEKQSIIIGIIVVCMIVITTACGVQTDTDKKSSATPSSVAASVSPDIEDNREISIKEADYDVNGSTSKKGARLIHVDENYIYFYDSYGLFIYNIEEKKIERSLDLKYIGCDNPDGKEKILFVGSNEGEVIYIFNETAQLSYDLELPYMRLYGGEVYKENSEDRMTEEDLEVALGDGPYGVYMNQYISADGTKMPFYDKKDKKHTLKLHNNVGRIGDLAYSIDGGKTVKVFE